MTTAATTTLTAFLTQALDADEAAARAADPRLTWLDADDDDMLRRVDREALEHIARHDPARVLAQVAALRAIVELHVERHDPFYAGECAVCVESAYIQYGDAEWCGQDWPCPTLRVLATIYADRPGFQEAWR